MQHGQEKKKKEPRNKSTQINMFNEILKYKTIQGGKDR